MNLTRVLPACFAFCLFAAPPSSLCSPITRPAADSVIFASSNLPIIVIDTHGATIPDEPKIHADMGIIDNGPGVRNTLGDSFNGYEGQIGIEVRGSSSQMFPKLQFAVETRDSLGNNLDASLLGFPAEKDWVLAAEYNDKSLLRNVILYGLANRTGHYASRARYCELVLNGDYRGVYILFEKVKRNKNRVPISKMGSADTSGDALTGGYIFKVDKIEGESTDGWYSGYPPYPGATKRVYFQYDYPKPEDLTPGQQSYIVSYVAGFESMMSTADYADTVIGYPSRINIGSFVDLILLSELSKNVDAYRLSLFLHKDRDSKGGKLVAGPVWDYNLAFGNADYYDASLIPGFQMIYETTTPMFMYNDDFQPPFWWKKIFVDPPFQSRLKARWQELRAGPFATDSINATIDSCVALLGEAQERNFRRWPILGTYVWPNAYVGTTYADEIVYLKQWISSRFSWLDAQWTTNSVEDPAHAATMAEEYALLQNYPNPFNPGTVVSYRLPDVSHVKLVVYDLLGREVATLVDGLQQAGTHSVTFDARRHGSQGGALAGGVYLCRLFAGGQVRTNKVMLLK